MTGWNDAATVEWYEAFCTRHARYSEANAALISQAELTAGLHVLDFGAGTGRTAEALLPLLGGTGRVVCVEPADAMRACGQQRLTDRRVEWRSDLPGWEPAFDRMVSGAALWQLDPLADWLGKLARLLKPGGALCFNMPALYLGEPDEPGGGSDPYLLELIANLAAAGEQPQAFGTEAVTTEGPSSDAVTAMLRQTGLQPRSWTFRLRLSQAAQADWLKIPVLTDGLMPGLSPRERVRRIDAALKSVDHESWKWEHWRGWTAWKL